MIPRFRKAYSNLRVNPFTSADLATDKTENSLVIPSSSPYFVQLLEVPRKESPVSTVEVYNVTNSSYMTEVTDAPAQNQFRVDYPDPDGQGTGIIEFSSLDAGKTVNISYKATGSPVVTEFLDTFMTRPEDEASEDLYYYDDGEIKRLPGAVNTTTKKIKAAVLSGVDVASTDATKDKAVSNALAKGWEDHKNSPHGDPIGTPVGTIVPWLGGYFTNGSNGGYTRTLGASNDVAGANGYLNSLGWYVCSGAACNVAGSPIYAGSGRYLPNLTDDRFIQGANVAGGSGGENTTAAHNHGAGSLWAVSVADHSHSINSSSQNSGNDSPNHTHSYSGTTGGESQGHLHTVWSDGAAVDSGANDRGHNHVYSGTTTGVSASHQHSYTRADSIASGGSHAHTVSGNTASVGPDENRPKFLSVFYIQRVI